MRTAEINRKTNETDITAALNLDGAASGDISTGIGFFDHMLTLFAGHSGFGLAVKAVGDLYVDCHHTVEDVGIVLGKLFADALGDKKGIKRYGSRILPMDETLVFCAVDISGRPFVSCDVGGLEGKLGEFDFEMLPEFMRAFAVNAGVTLHLKLMYGENKHHIAEGCFKALAHALKEACAVTGNAIPSTKGVL